MLIKVFLVVMIMVMWFGGPFSGVKMDKAVENSYEYTMGTMLDKKIVEYFLSHSNTLPSASNGCVSRADLEVMGLSEYDSYLDNTKYSYVPLSSDTFRLTVFLKNRSYVTKNSGKILSKAAKEEF